MKLISKLFSYFIPSPVLFFVVFFLYALFDAASGVCRNPTTSISFVCLSLYFHVCVGVRVCAAFNPWPLARVVPVVPARKSCTWQLSLGERRIVAKCFVFLSLSFSRSLWEFCVHRCLSPSPLHPSCGNATFAFRFCRRQAVPHLCIMSELKWRRCHLNTWRGTQHTLGRCLCLSAHFTQPASVRPPRSFPPHKNSCQVSAV